jgi:hypothetical protein
MRNTIRISLATIVGAAAFASIGCHENTRYRTVNDDLHMETSWAPYTSEYGPDTGVTGSSASPYVGGGVANKRPDPVVTSPAPSTTVETTTTTHHHY